MNIDSENPYTSESISKNVSNILRDCATLYSNKDVDYGSSWLLIGDQLSNIVGDVTLSSAHDHTAWFVFTRIMDKLNRVANLRFRGTEQKVNDEAISDTLRDIAAYAAMFASLESGLGSSASQGSAFSMLGDQYVETHTDATRTD